MRVGLRGKVHDLTSDEFSSILNGGSCIPDELLGFLCACVEGWEGQQCRQNIDEKTSRENIKIKLKKLINC